MLVAAYLVEAGLVLSIAPWTAFWDRNYFALAWPWLGAIMSSPYVRGGVTGVGLITTLTGVRDLVSAIAGRRAAPVPPASVGPPQW